MGNELTLGSKGIPGYNPYAKYLSTTVRQKLAEVEVLEEDLDLRGELRTLRALLADSIEKQAGDPEMNHDRIITLVKEVRTTIKVMGEMIDKLQGYIPVSMLSVVYAQVVQVVKANVKDSNVLQRISSQLGRVRVPADQQEAERVERAIADGDVPS